MFFEYFIKNPQTRIALTFLTHIISGIDGVHIKKSNPARQGPGRDINGQSTVPSLCSSLTEAIAYMAPDILQPDGGGCPAAAKLILQRTNLFAKRGLSENRRQKQKI